MLVMNTPSSCINALKPKRSGGIPWVDYGIVLLLVCVSGNPSFSHPDERKAAILLAVAALFLCVLIKRNALRADSCFILSVSLFGLILSVQCVVDQTFPVYNISAFFVKLFVAYAAVVLVRRFPAVYVNVMLPICVTSFVFYFLMLVSFSSGMALLSALKPVTMTDDTSVTALFSFVLHTYRCASGLDYMTVEGTYRNSGCFWEPGAFAGYLILGLVFLGLSRQDYTQRGYAIRATILSGGVLTTLSTMGYIMLGPTLIYLLWDKKRRNRSKLIIAATVLSCVACLLYNQLDFLGKKIEHQYDSIQYKRGEWENLRAGTLLRDWKYIKARPIIGWGLRQEDWFRLDDGLIVGGMGNGFSNFMVKLGVIPMVWVLACYYRSFRRLSNSPAKAIVGVLLLVGVLQGEVFLWYPLFFGLMFLGEEEGFRWCGKPQRHCSVMQVNRQTCRTFRRPSLSGGDNLLGGNGQ